MSSVFNIPFLGQIRFALGSVEQPHASEVPPQDSPPVEASGTQSEAQAPASEVAQEQPQKTPTPIVSEVSPADPQPAEAPRSQVPLSDVPQGRPQEDPAVEEERVAKEIDHSQAPSAPILSEEQPSPPSMPATESAKNSIAEQPALPSLQSVQRAMTPVMEETKKAAPAKTEAETGGGPVDGSVYREVPAIPDMLRRSIEEGLSVYPSVQTKWETLVESLCESEEAKAQMQASLNDLWENLLPSMSEQAQRLFRIRLDRFHQDVSRQLEASDLSPESFRTVIGQAQEGLERVIDAAYAVIVAILAGGAEVTPK
jgi:hypothetical protein